MYNFRGESIIISQKLKHPSASLGDASTQRLEAATEQECVLNNAVRWTIDRSNRGRFQVKKNDAAGIRTHDHQQYNGLVGLVS